MVAAAATGPITAPAIQARSVLGVPMEATGVEVTRDVVEKNEVRVELGKLVKVPEVEAITA
jgi:hypothetical protein